MLNKNIKVYHENFKNIDQLLFELEDRKANSVFQAVKVPSSQRREEENGFSGVTTWTETMDVLRGGYKEPLNQLKKGIFKVGKTDSFEKPKPKNDFVGYVPHVPNTLMNLPITMINREKPEKKQKMIHFTYSFCGDSEVKQDQLIKGGIHFLSLVNSLEKQGYRVKIDIAFFSVATKEINGYTVNVKEYGQNLNLLKLAFPLIHPAMLRRISLKYLETCPSLKDRDFLRGYGHPISFEFDFDGQKESDWLRKNNIIKNDNSYYCNVYQAFQAENIDQLAEKMGLAN